MAANGWRGSLALWFEHQEGRTRLMRRRHVGPPAAQRTFYPENDGSARVHLLHPSRGCQLEIDCHLAARAQAVLTTSAPVRILRSRQRPSEQLLRVHVAEGALCEYVPAETIVHPGAEGSMRTRAELAADAVYIGWDMVTFARPAANEHAGAGTFWQSVEIVRAGEQIWFERCCISGPEWAQGAPFGVAGEPIIGTLVYAGPTLAAAAARIRERVGEEMRHAFSVSELERVVVCRYLGDQMSQAKSLFRSAWNALRESGLHHGAVLHRGGRAID